MARITLNIETEDGGELNYILANILRTNAPLGGNAVQLAADDNDLSVYVTGAHSGSAEGSYIQSDTSRPSEDGSEPKPQRAQRRTKAAMDAVRTAAATPKDDPFNEQVREAVEEVVTAVGEIGKATAADVKKAGDRYIAVKGVRAAIALVDRVAGVKALSQIPEEKFAAVIDEIDGELAMTGG